MISVLCASRHRTALLARSVASLRELASGGIEIMVAADDDDEATATAARALGARTMVMPRAGYSLLHRYYNALAAASKGDWLLNWNDDAVMLTQDWDAVIAALPPEVLVADLQSAPFSPSLCCFPAVRREAVDALGYFSPDNPHCDTFWQDVGRATGTIGAVDVHVLHDRFDLTGSNNDGIWQASSTGRRQAEFYGAENQAEIARCIAVIRETFA